MANLVEVSFLDNMRISDLSDLGLPICLPSPVRLNLGPVVAEGSIQAVFTSKKLSEEFANTSGASSENFSLSTRIFDFPLERSDEVIVRTADSGLPLVVRRHRDVIVNFDIKATELFRFTDSPRPIYTYIPGFNIHAVPEGIRRPISNVVQSLRVPRRLDVTGSYLKIQIARTQKLIEVGALVSIVTHSEQGLSERLDFLDVYNQYLSYVRSCPSIWFATARELFQYWSHAGSSSVSQTA
jgi:hypothetical protein